MRRTLIYGWWYLCIALGFVLLAARQIMLDGNPTGIVLRLIIAAGFGALSWMVFRQKPRDS